MAPFQIQATDGKKRVKQKHGREPLRHWNSETHAFKEDRLSIRLKEEIGVKSSVMRIVCISMFGHHWMHWTHHQVKYR